MNENNEKDMDMKHALKKAFIPVHCLPWIIARPI